MSSSLAQRPTHPMVDALASAAAVLDDTLAASAWSLSDDDLIDLLVAQAEIEAKAAAVGLQLAREADARNLGVRQGATSTAGWLRDRLRLRPAEAKRRVLLGAALDGELAATGSALRSGAISLDAAAVIRRAVTDLPIESPARGQAEAFLLEQAAVHGPDGLARLGIHLLHVVDPEALEQLEERARASRELEVSDRPDGISTVRVRAEREAVATLLSALDPLAAPAPAADGTHDLRSPARRRADALFELASRWLDAGQAPTTRAARPHVTITADLSTLLGLPRAPAAATTWSGPVSGQTLRRIACDAGVTRVLLDPAGVPLDVGREHRIVTPGIWAALVARDVGCAFPGCTRPAEWCIAHHRIHWADGGETSLPNLLLLCGAHHVTVHHRGWDVTLAQDGRPEFIPPPWVDPDRAPRRNTYWDTVRLRR